MKGLSSRPKGREAIQMGPSISIGRIAAIVAVVVWASVQHWIATVITVVSGRLLCEPANPLWIFAAAALVAFAEALSCQI
jgi:hypothetical protein